MPLLLISEHQCVFQEQCMTWYYFQTNSTYKESHLSNNLQRLSYDIKSLSGRLLRLISEREALEQIAQTGSRCPVPRDTHGQTRQGSEQPAVGVTVQCRGVVPGGF